MRRTPFKVPVPGKYGSSKSSYKGRMYDSRMEAEYAIVLDTHLSSKRLTEVVPQYKVILMVNGKIITTHLPDFLVTLPDGRQKFVEVKGMPTDVWRIKRKLTEALFPHIPYLVNPTDKQLFL